ncbi:MAG: phosphatidylglycerophosphatase A [Candidatus Omnitrophica bacterium]|nr:phosphatidylglycerophosphatase A [Candidatus Omnitrophota bacterium]MCM8799324.1 phosphatidylglycerophosphatase A [Candidatus Omnitrophota bacterium]
MNKINRFITKTIATFFFIGYIPILPGTFASAFSLCLIWFLRKNVLLYILFFLIILVAGFLVSSSAEKLFGKKDAKEIVIDEVIGIFLSFIFVPLNCKFLFLGFLLFRILDGLKVIPSNYTEKLEGAKGIIFDDLIAGLYTNIILQFSFRLTL